MLLNLLRERVTNFKKFDFMDLSLHKKTVGS